MNKLRVAAYCRVSTNHEHRNQALKHRFPIMENSLQSVGAASL